MRTSQIALTSALRAAMVVLKVDGHAWTMHGTKDVYDAHGTKLFVLRKKLLSVHFTVSVSTASPAYAPSLCEESYFSGSCCQFRI